MNKKLFERLSESMRQHEEIRRGERAPSREFHVDGDKAGSIRSITGLGHAKFARLLGVDVGTLRNWEQGRREPTGPVKAQLKAIKHDPKVDLKALAADPSAAAAHSPSMCSDKRLHTVRSSHLHRYYCSRDSTAASKALYTAIMPLCPSLKSDCVNSQSLYFPEPLMLACILAFRMVTPLRHLASSSFDGRSFSFMRTRTDS